MAAGAARGRRIRSGRAALAAILFLLPVAPRPARAQTLSTGMIVGGVVDGQGAPLNGVTVTLTNRVNGQRSMARTDRGGQFGSALLAPGHYDALFERLGFRPHRVEDILVVAGGSRDLRVSLETLTPDMRTPSVSTAPVLQSVSGGSGPDRWLLGQSASMPFEGQGLSALLATSSLAGRRFEIEGLPATHSSIVVDGIPFARRPRGFDVLALDVAVPLYALTQAAIVTNDVDVEYPGAGASLAGHTQRGGRQRGASGFGDFGSDATASGSASPPTYSSYRAGMLGRGSIINDTASFVVGGEILHSRSPYDALWVNDAATTALAQVAAGTFNRNLGRYTAPALETMDRQSAFARMDMHVSGSTSISGFGLYSMLDQPEPVAPWTERPVGSTITPQLRNILLGASVVTSIDENMMTEIDAGFESSRSSGRPQGERGQSLVRTTVVDAAHTFGSDRNPDYLGQLTAFYLRGTLHFRSGAHRRKIGLIAELPRYKIPNDGDRAGSFTFANVDDFRDSFGYYRVIEGSDNRAEFPVRRISILAQDTWRPVPSVEMVVGARVTSFRQPDSTGPTLSNGWVALTNQSNRAFPGRKVEFEPRFAITINPANRPELELRGGVSIDAEPADPALIGEIFSNNGSLRVRSGLGRGTVWPDVQIGPTIQLRNETLSVIGPDFRGPRSTRAFASLSRSFGAGAVRVGFVYRKTEFLPQRVDLNLLPGVAVYDQNGRPVFGTLDKTGSMLTAEYGSNRRFGTFEEVWGLQSAGESRYTGVTVTAERRLFGPVGFFGSYTWSKTEDDWLLGNAGDPFSQLAPFPDSIGPDQWTKGTSDLDVPHRGVAGLEVILPGAFEPKLAAIYRFQSGYPFTPGFRPGVDVNADGSGSNDPAFIDESVSGTSDLLSSWPCLAADAGGFASRNACRGPDITSLDARFSVTFRQADRYSAAIVLDGLDLISSDAGELDRAVYLVDPSAPLVTHADGSIDVPLVINPDFGRMLTRYSPQRRLRVGVRVSF